MGDLLATATRLGNLAEIALRSGDPVTAAARQLDRPVRSSANTRSSTSHSLGVGQTCITQACHFRSFREHKKRIVDRTFVPQQSGQLSLGARSDKGALLPRHAGVPSSYGNSRKVQVRYEDTSRAGAIGRLRRFYVGCRGRIGKGLIVFASSYTRRRRDFRISVLMVVGLLFTGLSAVSWPSVRARVTSKAGTTEAALQSMEANQIKSRIVEAVRAAATRSSELGEEFGKD